MSPFLTVPLAEVTRQSWRLLDEFHIIFYAKWTRMQLLDMVLACPSWCKRRSCSPLWCRGRFLAQFVLGNMGHFPVRSCICVMCSVFGCCFWYTEHLILREMTWSVGAMLGSTVDKYSALVLGWLLEEFHDFLRDWVVSVPEVDSCRFSLWPRSSSTTAVACILLVWLVF